MKKTLALVVVSFITLACAEHKSGTAEFRQTLREAKKGDARAQNSLGSIYERGRGVAKDYAEAVKWYRKAAEKDHAIAQHNLGIMYANGRGVAQDYAEAVKWFRKAAEQDYANAQSNLGLMYENGQGVAKNYAEAVKWFRKAAEQDYAIAQYNLGVFHNTIARDEAIGQSLGLWDDTGGRVAQGYAEAYFWFNLAARNGDEDRVKVRDIAANELSTTALREAQKRAREWKSRPQNTPIPKED